LDWNNGFIFGIGGPSGSSNKSLSIIPVVRMKTKNKIMLALLIISAITTSLVPVYAETNQLAAKLAIRDRLQLATDKTRIIKPTLQASSFTEINELPDIDQAEIGKRIEEAEQATETEDITRSVLWYLNANGYTNTERPVSSAADSTIRIRLQLIAEKVKMTEFGALYKVYWGRVNHNGEQYFVEGYALLDSNGIFYMKLNGDVAFCCIGRVYRSWFGVRVSMKGYLVKEGTTYSHRMRGWAIPLTQNLLVRLRNHLK
jgi:hypothetical protein